MSLSSSEALPYAHVQVYFDGPSHYVSPLFFSKSRNTSIMYHVRQEVRSYLPVLFWM